ncbi:unnamed protein product [Caenorhabditis auriculariae]|uniref:Nose resistant-to-fluoxetine protein N-terminal domain-containing protein n=1 Tax=Caenorhabditis auriculariae TaxID=2777116 RepID=A0A8S1HFF0_9PELO|nr:unnamed protein product [Caenorhabditis auriculariae]
MWSRAVFFLFLAAFASSKGSYKYEGSLFDSAELEFDEEDEQRMGSLFTKYLADSRSQLILDLDLFQHFFNYGEAYRQGAEEGNVELVKYAIQIVDKLKEFDISTACVGDMFHLAWTAVEYATHVEEHRNCSDCHCTPLFQQKKNERHWIFNVLDAMGKVPSGVSSGNNLWVGSWNTCRKIKVKKNHQGQHWKGQYCLAHVHAYERDNPLKSLGDEGPVDQHCFEPPKPKNTSLDTQCFNLFPLLNFGVCLPDTCTEYDVKRMLTFGIRMTEGMMGVDKVCRVSVECRNENEENSMTKSSLAMFALYFLIATIVVVVFGTLYDLFIIQNATEPIIMELQHPFIKFILAYSLYTNGIQILQSKKREGEINSLHGVRFLSMCWIILGHTYYYIGTSLTTDNLLPTLVNFPQQFYTQIIVQAPLAVDSFFFLSGMLAAFFFFKKLLKGDGRSLKVFNPRIWLLYDLKRYTRITPTYAVVMLMDVTLFTYVSNGPFWRPIEKQGCRHAWWTNFLYLNNFLLQDVECCMGWTWYLANDFQFHLILMPLLVIVFYKWGMKAGFATSTIIVVISSVLKLVIIQYKGFPPAPLLTAKLQIVKQLDEYWNHVYVRPYVRCAPFIVGVVVGYLLNALTEKDQKDLNIKMSRKHIIIGWVTSTVLGLYSVFGLYNFARTGNISEWWKILYIVFGRPAYALSLGWVVFACSSGNGGQKVMLNVKSQKSDIQARQQVFVVEVLRALVEDYVLRPQPFHFTTFGQMLRHTLEAIFVSYLLAFFFCLAFEKPFTAIDEMLLPQKKSSRGRQNGDVELQPIEQPLLKTEASVTSKKGIGERAKMLAAAEKCKEGNGGNVCADSSWVAVRHRYLYLSHHPNFSRFSEAAKINGKRGRGEDESAHGVDRDAAAPRRTTEWTEASLGQRVWVCGAFDQLFGSGMEPRKAPYLNAAPI